MPLYEYLCRSCETRFEKLVRRFGEEVACPACAGAAVDKQLSVFAVAGGTARAADGPCGEGGCESGACGSGGCRFPS